MVEAPGRGQEKRISADSDSGTGRRKVSAEVRAADVQWKRPAFVSATR